jgi:phosphate-selective porin OprO/OprP
MIFKYFIIVFLVFSPLYSKELGYPPLFSNESDASIYDWNALQTKWINTRAIVMAAFDSTYYKDNPDIPQLEHYTKADIRGIRLGAGGTINFQRPWTYIFSGSINSFAKDFNASTDKRVTLYDAVIGIPLNSQFARIKIGRFKEPISMERLMGMVFEQVMERPMHLETFTTTRNDGISFNNLLYDQKITLKSGLFYNDNFNWTTRITFLAYQNPNNHSLIHLGIGYKYEKINKKSISFDVKPEQYFVNPILSTGNIKANSDDTLNLEFTYLKNSLWIASEFSGKYIHRENNSNTFFYGFHTSLSYFLTGEKRGYNKRIGIVRRIRPKVDFNKGGFGAIELAYRYSYINLNDKDIRAGKMDIHSLGAIWHATYGTQLHIQFSRANPKIPFQSTPKPLDSVQFRFVVIID